MTASLAARHERSVATIPNVQNKLFREWFAKSDRDVVAGAVVALALILEAVAFFIIAGVEAKVGFTRHSASQS